MCKNCENYNKLMRAHWSDDIWDPSRDMPRDGVDIIPLEEWEYDEEREHQRAGGSNWTPGKRRVKITNGAIEALAIQTHEWIGGYNSGGPYYDYYPICDEGEDDSR